MFGNSKILSKIKKYVKFYRAHSNANTNKSHFENHDPAFREIDVNLIGICDYTIFSSEALLNGERREEQEILY